MNAYISLTALTGGGANSLDGIAVANLLDGSSAIVMLAPPDNRVYFHVWDEDSVLAESSPDVIKADDNGVAPGRWILKKVYVTAPYGTLPIANGGTESTTAATAIAALGGVAHSLATAINDFIVASGAGVFIKKTLAEVKTILGLGSAAYVDLDTDGTLAANSDTKVATQKATKTYADGLVVGLLDDRGSYDASGNVWPSTGGSGTAGAILKGDLWYISVQGTLGGVLAVVGSSIRALVNTPGQTAGNWDILNVGLGYTPENAANKRTSFQATPDDTHYISEKLAKDSLDGKISHSLATALSDMLFASGVGAFVKKTLADGRTLLGLDGATTDILVGGGVGTAPVWTTATGAGPPVRQDSPSLIAPTRSVANSDNDSSLDFSTTAFAKSQDAILRRNPDQAVHMTAAASGSTGITVADSDQLDMGTNNGMVAGFFNVPDLTPAANIILYEKLTGGVGVQLELVATTGIIRFTINATAYNSSVAPAATDKTMHHVAAVWTVGAVNTTVDFYWDCVALGTQQTAANPGTVSNAAALYILGTSAVRTEGDTSGVVLYNRALTAAEVLSLYRNGIAFVDKWGSQTNLLTGIYDDFNTNCANGAAIDAAYSPYWVDNSATSTSITSKVWSITANNGAGLGVGGFIIGKSYRVSGLNITTLTGTWNWKQSGGTVIESVTGTGLKSVEFTAVGEQIFLTSGSAGATLVIDQSGGVVTEVQIGATLALESEGIQVDGWKDSSTNGLNATYPTTGSSITRHVQLNTEMLLSVTNVSLAANADTTIYTVPTGRRALLTKAILVAGADAGATSALSIGADGTETDFIPAAVLSNLDAANDVVILQPVPVAALPVKNKSYAAGTVIQAQVATQSGGATNTLYLFGILY